MRALHLSLLIAMFALSSPLGVFAEPATVSLHFETECLDLDTGVVEEDCETPAAADATWDVIIAFHADREAHAVLAHRQADGIEVSHLVGATFEDVGPADVDGAEFSADLVDVAFTTDRVILVRTDLGVVFKLGNVMETVEGLTLDHEQL